MKAINILMFALAALFFRDSYADDARLSIRCVNPEIKNLNFQTHASGRAYSQPVQFNIGLTNYSKGAVSVDDKNEGICIIKINEKYSVRGLSATFLPGGSWTGSRVWQESPTPHAVDNSVRVNYVIIDNQTIQVNVSKGGSATGNVTLIFRLDYELASKRGKRS